MITSQEDCAAWIATGVIEIETVNSENGQIHEHDLQAYILGVKQLIVSVRRMDSMGSLYRPKIKEKYKELSIYIKKTDYNPDTAVNFWL